MKSLCILMPVFCGEERVAYNLKTIVSQCEKYDVDIYLCDSSTDNSIYNLFLECNSNNLFYLDKRESSETKLIDSINDLVIDYEYIWLVGDSIVLNFEIDFPYFVKYSNKSFDIIHFCMSKDLTEEIVYFDSAELYLKEIWYMTCYGSTILSSDLLKSFDWDNNGQIFSGSFLYLMSIFVAIANVDIKAVCIKCNFYSSNPYRIASGWVKRGDALKVFGKNWVEDNRQLPKKYDACKKEAILSADKYTGLFSWKHLVALRLYGNITFRQVNEYRKYIPRITTTPLWWFYVVSLIPQAFVKLIWKMMGREY